MLDSGGNPPDPTSPDVTLYLDTRGDDDPLANKTKLENNGPTKTPSVYLY